MINESHKPLWQWILPMTTKLHYWSNFVLHASRQLQTITASLEGKVPDLIDFLLFIHNANYYLRRLRCCPHFSWGKFVISFSRNKTCLMLPKFQHRLQQSNVFLTSVCSLLQPWSLRPLSCLYLQIRGVAVEHGGRAHPGYLLFSLLKVSEFCHEK